MANRDWTARGSREMASGSEPVEQHANISLLLLQSAGTDGGAMDLQSPVNAEPERRSVGSGDLFVNTGGDQTEAANSSKNTASVEHTRKWRAGYGSVAQSALDATSPTANSNNRDFVIGGLLQPWSAGPDTVAQPSSDASSPNNRDSGGGGAPQPWRAGYGVVAQPALDASNPNNAYNRGYYTGDGSQWRTGSGTFARPVLEATDPGNQYNRAPYGEIIQPVNGSGNAVVPGSRCGVEPPVIRPTSPYNQVAPVAQDVTTPSGNSDSQHRQSMQAQPGLYPPGYVPGENDQSRWKPSPNQLPGNDAGVNRTNGAANGGSARGLFSRGVDPREREIVDRSLHQQANMSAYFWQSTAGAILGSGPLPWAIDRLTAGSDSWFARKWRETASPIGAELKAESRYLQDAQTVHQKALQERANVFSRVKQSMRPVRDEMKVAQQQLDTFKQKVQVDLTKAKTPAQRQLLTDKHTMLETASKNVGHLSQSLLDSVKLPPNARTPRNGKFLTTAEHDLLSRQLQLHADKLALVEQYRVSRVTADSAEAGVRAATDRMAKIHAGKSEFNFFGTKRGPWNHQLADDATAIEKTTGQWRGDRWNHKIGEGALIAGTALATDWLFDKMLGNDQKTFSRPSYYALPAISAALLLPLPINATGKAAFTALAIGGAKLADEYLPLPNARYGAIMQPNWIDAVGMSMAWMMPWNSANGRVLSVAGAYGLGRLANVGHNWMKIPIPGLGDIDHGAAMDADLGNALGHDDGKLSHETFKNVVQAGHRLGMENDGALRLQIENFMYNHQNDLNKAYFAHGTAALFTALGDMILERGAKIDKIDSMKNGRILAGDRFDLGGQALQFYRPAASYLIDMQNNAVELGLSPEQVEGLKKSREYISSQMSIIYGEHQVEHIVKSLKEDFRYNEQDMDAFAIQLANQVKAIPASTVQLDPQYVAKLCRDVAIVHLAIAEYKATTHSNAGDAVPTLELAEKFLVGAGRWDARSPDLEPLKQVAKRVTDTIREQRLRQSNHGAYNPFKVNQERHP